MRKIAELFSLAALAALALITVNAFYGPHRLPARIPVHFDAAGQPNGWGSPSALLLLPAVGAGLYLLFTLVSRFPSAFNYPVKVTEFNRERLQQLAVEVLALMKAEILVLFALMDFAWVHAIRNPGHGLGSLTVGIFVAVILATVFGYMAAMIRASKPAA